MFFLRLIFIVLFLLSFRLAESQGVKGRLTDAQNNPVPFAAIYDENSYAGTTSNSEGFYELRLSPGKHSLVFKSLGYYVEKRMVDVGTSFVLINLQMKEQAYELKDVVVTPGKEDPAYAIMRKVISMAPYHLNQVKEYSADVYLRGAIHVIHIPKFISKRIEVNGKKGVIKSGDVYMEESINQIDFKAPDKYDQKVKSFRTNFPGENTVSPMQIVRSSFYQQKIDDAISPLASNAFSYYKYRYEGFSTEGEHTIYKIRVTPKRNSQQLLSGHIFILDKLWCLHSVDVVQEMFFGKLSYQEIFSPVKENAWLPISYVFHVNAGMMGVKGEFKYTSSVKYQNVVLNDKKRINPGRVVEQEEAPKTEVAKAPDPKKQKKQEEIERLMSKENLNNREMIKLAGMVSEEVKQQDTVKKKSLELAEWNNTKVTIEKDAMKMDTSYWNAVRPIPLTSVETGLSDSIKNPKIKGTDSTKSDTASVKKKGLGKAGKFIFGGAGFKLFDSTVLVRYNGLVGVNNFDFNTVDGFVFRQSFDITVRTDSMHHIKIRPGASYAFSRNAFMWWVNSSWEYAPLRGGSLSLNYSKSTVDFNPEGGMHNAVNALSSLFFRRNYKKFYEAHQVNIENSIDVANGLRFTARAGYREETMLENHSDFSFFYRNSRSYSPNKLNQFSNHQDNIETYLSARLEYTPQYYYRIRGGKKYYQHSKYPTFFARYKKAVPGVFGSSADYELLEAGVRQTKNWGMMNSFSWNITAGEFLSARKMYTSDYKFFNNQPLPVIIGNVRNSFFLAGLYDNLSYSNFVEGHITFSTPYLLLKYIPLISNKIWVENLHLNYLYTKQGGHYWETGYSISQIYAIGGVGVYAGFRGKDFQSVGVRMTLGF